MLNSAWQVVNGEGNQQISNNFITAAMADIYYGILKKVRHLWSQLISMFPFYIHKVIVGFYITSKL